MGSDKERERENISPSIPQNRHWICEVKVILSYPWRQTGRPVSMVTGLYLRRLLLLLQLLLLQLLYQRLLLPPPLLILLLRQLHTHTHIKFNFDSSLCVYCSYARTHTNTHILLTL